jgi:hypothetical protein
LGTGGVAVLLPVKMSATITVPAAVPFDFQSSLPLTPSSAAKYSVLLTLTNDDGVEPA